MKSLPALLLSAVLISVKPAPAQDASDARVVEILESFIEEERRVLTCSSLDAQNHASLVNLWNLFVQDVLTLLKQGGVSVMRQATFAAAARPDALVMPGDNSFEKVRAFCDADPEWSRRAMHQRSFPRYAELRMLLEAGKN